MNPIELFILLLKRESIINKDAVLFDSSTNFNLLDNGVPTLEGQFCLSEGENYSTVEFIFYNNRWRTVEQYDELRSKIIKGKEEVKQKAVEEKDQLSVELRTFYETLPNDPNSISKGKKRELLKQLPRELLIVKYPVAKYPWLYKFLNENDKTSTIEEDSSKEIT